VPKAEEVIKPTGCVATVAKHGAQMHRMDAPDRAMYSRRPDAPPSRGRLKPVPDASGAADERVRALHALGAPCQMQGATARYFARDSPMNVATPGRTVSSR
jgi:hypothetical protein